MALTVPCPWAPEGLATPGTTPQQNNKQANGCQTNDIYIKHF